METPVAAYLDSSRIAGKFAHEYGRSHVYRHVGVAQLRHDVAPHAYLWINKTETASGPRKSYRIATLQSGSGVEEVLMKHFMKMQGEITAADLVSLKPADLRCTGVASGEPFKLDRARPQQPPGSRR